MQKYFLTMIKMRKVLKNLFNLLIVIFLLNGCQSVKDGLTTNKNSNSDEFLIEKKSPLVTPPEFDKLPKPETLNEKEANYQDQIDLTTILQKDKSSKKKNSETNTSIENSVIDKIKNN
jgi:hypothetical protein